MIAVSSHKPGCTLHHEAKKTWDDQFSFIVYFGPEETNLNGPKTAFVEAGPFPAIRDLAAFCSRQPGWSAILNADIRLGPEFSSVCAYLERSELLAATSGRYQVYPNQEAIVEDLGLDIFAAEQSMWKQVAQEIPPTFRIGNILWDTWLLGFLLVHCGHKLFDFTRYRVVFHPRHPTGERAQSVASTYRDKYIEVAKWPIPA